MLRTGGESYLAWEWVFEMKKRSQVGLEGFDPPTIRTRRACFVLVLYTEEQEEGNNEQIGSIYEGVLCGAS
jgi:hypothetical protein